MRLSQTYLYRMKIDYTSREWLMIAAYLEEELQRLRRSNDAVGLPEADANALRGEIRLCKKLLALPQKADRELVSATDF